MCLAIPMKVISINGVEAVVEQSGVSRVARVDFIPDIEVGDHVLVHAGLAISKIDEHEAAETLALLQELDIDEAY